jgi:sensor domain CHASE-containing protein
MKIKPGYVLRNVAGENIVVPIGGEAVNFNGVLTLNKSGKMLWESLSKGATLEELIAKIVSVYEVDEKTAKADVLAFLKKLQTKDIVIEHD